MPSDFNTCNWEEIPNEWVDKQLVRTRYQILTINISEWSHCGVWVKCGETYDGQSTYRLFLPKWLNAWYASMQWNSQLHIEYNTACKYSNEELKASIQAYIEMMMEGD